MSSFARVVFSALMLILTTDVAVQAKPGKGWQGWTDDLFEKARIENRLVILDLEAVWCHWCHVMEEETYQDPVVKELLKTNFIAVRVDQDENPALSSRYGDWGWPATILFGPDGTELAKFSGYIPARRMASILQAFIDDPTPGPSVFNIPEVQASSSPFLNKDARSRLLENFDAVWDEKYAGWGQIHKFIHTESLDYAFKAALKGDKDAEKRARRTLDAALNLIDREWGGVYQYSDQRDWQSPHYEKIMWYQAQYLRQYAMAYSIWKEEKYAKAAKDIARYLTTLLTSENGAFFTSQDADLNSKTDGKTFYALSGEERAKLGMPRIDTNIYARDNGWAIAGLVSYANAMGDKDALQRAVRAARWVLDNRQIGSGGFAHGEKDNGGPYLGATLAMGEAMLALYAATGERDWLTRADAAGAFIAKTFRGDGSGFITSAKTVAKVGVFAKPVRQIEENIQLARFANALHRYTGKSEHREMAAYTMKYLTSEQITTLRRFLIGVVLADEELSIEPVHLTVVGKKSDKTAQALYDAARRYPALYKRTDWFDPSEGPMLNSDIKYPELEAPAAFACGNGICSLPVFEPSKLDEAVKRMTRAITRQASAK